MLVCAEECVGLSKIGSLVLSGGAIVDRSEEDRGVEYADGAVSNSSNNWVAVGLPKRAEVREADMAGREILVRAWLCYNAGFENIRSVLEASSRGSAMV